MRQHPWRWAREQESKEKEGKMELSYAKAAKKSAFGVRVEHYYFIFVQGV